MIKLQIAGNLIFAFVSHLFLEIFSFKFLGVISFALFLSALPKDVFYFIFCLFKVRRNFYWLMLNVKTVEF